MNTTWLGGSSSVFNKRVEGGRREHVHLVDDVYLVAPARRRELHAPDDLLANVLHAGAARGVQLVHIGVLAGGDHLAIVAGAVGLGRRALLAQKRLGQKARRGGLAGAARAREQVGVAHLVLGDGVFDGALDVLLTDHVLEDLRSVLAIECLGHGLLPAFLLGLGSRCLHALGRPLARPPPGAAPPPSPRPRRASRAPRSARARTRPRSRARPPGQPDRPPWRDDCSARP